MSSPEEVVRYLAEVGNAAREASISFGSISSETAKLCTWYKKYLEEIKRKHEHEGEG